MRDRDRSSNDQRHVKGVHKLFPRYPYFGALLEVIGNTVVAAQHNRRGQTHQFLRLLVERAVFISLSVEREKPFDAKMAAPEQLLVHFRPIPIKIVHLSDSFRAPPFCNGRDSITALPAARIYARRAFAGLRLTASGLRVFIGTAARR